MDFTDITQARLAQQQVSATRFTTPAGLVEWLGAVQAQDYPMAKWALGLRLSEATDRSVESAIDRGEVLRTHLLRPTWHFVAPADIYWLLELTAPQIRRAQQARLKDLELTSEVIARSEAVIEKALRGGKHLSRAALVAELNQAHIATDENRASHILVCAELDGLVCSGPASAGRTGYTLLEERVPKTPALSHAEALARLALRYFTSHGPATAADFTWWSGLPVGDARQGLELVKGALHFEVLGEQTYWFAGDLPASGGAPVYALPAYDEYLISYADRSAALPPGLFDRTISSNGIFYPIVVSGGIVTGTWKRTRQKDALLIETGLFAPPDDAGRAHIQQALQRYARFMEKEAVIRLD